MRLIFKVENLLCRIFFFFLELFDYKENYSVFVFLGYNIKLGFLGVVFMEIWKFF